MKNNFGVVALALGIAAIPVVVNQHKTFVADNEAAATACVAMTTAEAECDKVNPIALASSNEDLHTAFMKGREVGGGDGPTIADVRESVPVWLNLY